MTVEGGLSIVPLELLLSSIDVDLNNDGELDRSTTDFSNPDGLSVGLEGSGVPAVLAE